LLRGCIVTFNQSSDLLSSSFNPSSSDGPLYAFSVFTPTIIKTLGTWTTIESNLLSVPVYVVAAIFTVAIGYIADKKGNRCIISMCVSSVGIIGYIVLLSLDPRTHGAACYFAVYLSAVGI
jgi:MFS family permease